MKARAGNSLMITKLLSIVELGFVIFLQQEGYWCVIDDTVKITFYMKLTIPVSSNKTKGLGTLRIHFINVVLNQASIYMINDKYIKI